MQDFQILFAGLGSMQTNETILWVTFNCGADSTKKLQKLLKSVRELRNTSLRISDLRILCSFCIESTNQQWWKFASRFFFSTNHFFHSFYIFALKNLEWSVRHFFFWFKLIFTVDYLTSTWVCVNHYVFFTSRPLFIIPML